MNLEHVSNLSTDSPKGNVKVKIHVPALCLDEHFKGCFGHAAAKASFSRVEKHNQLACSAFALFAASLQKVDVNESQQLRAGGLKRIFLTNLSVSAAQGNRSIFQNVGKLKTIGLYG